MSSGAGSSSNADDLGGTWYEDVAVCVRVRCMCARWVLDMGTWMAHEAQAVKHARRRGVWRDGH